MKASNIYKLLTAALLAVAASSCGQDPIFYTIATEPPPIPPLIEGAPTNMAVFERKDPAYPEDPDKTIPVLYVASGRLHWYVKAEDADMPGWNLSGGYEIQQPPGGRIISLATTRTYLYALCMTGHGVSTNLWRIGHNDDAWDRVENESGYPILQSIRADSGSDQLFVAAGKDSYALLYLDDTDSGNALQLLSGEVSSMLSGVVSLGGDFYLSTRGSGIWRADSGGGIMQLSDASVIENPRDNRIFMGIIKLADDMIVAIERGGGNLYTIDGDSFKPIEYSGTLDGEPTGTMASGWYATGAMALWKCPVQSDAVQGAMMLIVGIQGSLYTSAYSSYTHGYVEFRLNDDGSLNTNESRHISGNLQSVGHNDRYRATIGKHPINHLFQAPEEIDPMMTFFASTQTAGLWSYRERSIGGWQWNAEN